MRLERGAKNLKHHTSPNALKSLISGSVGCFKYFAFRISHFALAAKNAVDMAHFAARFDVGFAVEMERQVWVAGEAGDAVYIVADEVFHDGIVVALAVAQGPAGDGADMLFELIHRAAVLGPMAGIVDAGGDFVDDEILGCDEELDPITPI